MAMHIPKAPGFASMLKDGSRHFAGVEEAVNRNIRACKEFADTLKTAYGPSGMNKMIINHIEKLFVTNDAGTIIQELDVEHPAAKIMTLASTMMDQEVGDGTNFVIIFCGALLSAADELLKMGLKPPEITLGFEMALDKARELLPSLIISEIKDIRSEQEILGPIRTAVMSKQLGNEDLLAKLIARACKSIINDDNTSFNVDNVRVCKVVGGGLNQSEVVSGLVFKRAVESNLLKVKDAKIAIYSCPLDIMQTETKGTVLIKTARELTEFSAGEESQLEEQIKAIAEGGATVVVSGGKIGDMAMHFLNKYNLMGVRLMSKFDLRRLCKSTGAVCHAKVELISTEELGIADEVYVDEIGGTNVIIFKVGRDEGKIATILLRGATDNFLDDIERAVNDGVNTYKGLTRDKRLVAGGGAFELELARQIAAYGNTLPGLEQYSVKKFASALECFIKVFAENMGMKSNEVLARVNAAHHEGKNTVGFNIEDGSNGVCDMKEKGILDLALVKKWGMEYATEAACTILLVDQIIMAKKAGGPKPQAAPRPDDD